MKHISELFYIGLEFTIEFISAVFMIILLGIISILDFASLFITSITLRILGVIMVISLLYYIIR